MKSVRWLDRIDIEEVAASARASSAAGEINDFIPALSRVPRSNFGLSVQDASGRLLAIGDCTRPFSIQSISKLFALIILMRRSDCDLWRRLSANASVIDRFDSVASLEFSRGIPSSPFLNAGALVMTDMLLQAGHEPEDQIERLLEQSAGIAIRINEEVARSETETADRNRAIAYYLRSFGNLQNPVDRVVDAYCRMCAIELSSDEVAAFAARLSEGCSQRADYDRTKLLSVMRNCGLYGESLDIGRRFGVPAKSGSGGGILAVFPQGIGVGIWSPPLNSSGNSVAGISVLRQFGRVL